MRRSLRPRRTLSMAAAGGWRCDAARATPRLPRRCHHPFLQGSAVILATRPGHASGAQMLKSCSFSTPPARDGSPSLFAVCNCPDGRTQPTVLFALTCNLRMFQPLVSRQLGRRRSFAARVNRHACNDTVNS
jgi:hypothetical protein